MTGRRRGAVVLALTAAVPSVLSAAPAQAAGWPPTTARTTSGTLRVAVLGQAFTALNGVGTATSTTFTASKVLATTTTAYVDLLSTGTVAERLAGTVSLQTFLSTTVTVSRCSSSWSAGACPGTQSTLVATVLPARISVDWSPTPVLPAAAVHLKVTLGGSVSNQVTLTAVAQPGRAPGDRTGA